MKLEILTILENAAWITILVDQAGDIQLANHVARSWLGIGPFSRPNLKSFLTPGGSEPLSPEIVCESSCNKSIRIELKSKSNKSETFLCLGSRIHVEGEKLTILQLLPSDFQPPSPPTPPALPNPIAIVPNVASLTPDNPSALKQKLDCALQLTRTVALDFNNALTGILGHVSYLLAKTEPNHPWRNALVEVEKSAEKAAEVAYDLAAFSREEKDSHLTNSANINDVVRQTIELVRKNAPPTIQWISRLEQSVYSATFDEAKIQQAVFKVLENAIQALGTQGTINVTTKNCDV